MYHSFHFFRSFNIHEIYQNYDTTLAILNAFVVNDQILNK